MWFVLSLKLCCYLFPHILSSLLISSLRSPSMLLSLCEQHQDCMHGFSVSVWGQVIKSKLGFILRKIATLALL